MVTIPLRQANALLLILLVLCIGRLWLMPLPSSFWVDEIVTRFVVEYGPDHPSLAIAAPQAWKSIYYFVPRAADAMFGFSEIAYRVPSVLAMAVALLLIARLAARLIHPEAAWFAAFACLALRGFNYEAADARPYALGFCVAAAAVTFLVRWLDDGRWRDALLFAVFAALLWRVHLIFWPFYFVFAIYTAIRRPTKLGQLAVVVALIALSLVPVLIDALTLYREANEHVITSKPSFREFFASLKLGLILPCAIGAWIIARFPRHQNLKLGPGLALMTAWWLCQPVGLFLFSWITGSSVFVPRYYSLSLPGAALVATAAASAWLPKSYWKLAAAICGIGVLVFLGEWRTPWPPHHNSDWRTAAATVSANVAGSDTPVLCPSPFIEARPPVWRPDYPLPAFLYAHLSVYSIGGRPYLFPYRPAPEAERYAAQILPSTGRLILYGHAFQVDYWRDWLASRPEMAGWTHQSLGPFGDVQVVVFRSR